jgi:cellulose synthase/poly-beta-1,6-N-acetylglucosamine synthase-like glycosyltransferase
MITKIVKKYDKHIHRLLEIVPGLLTWSLILSPIWLGILYPPAVIYMLTFLTVYWTYMAIRHTAGLFIGYPKYKKEMATNWAYKCKKLDFDSLPDSATLPPSIEETKHLILIPAVDEPKAVLEPAIKAIMNQTFPLNQVTLVYTIEKKEAKKTKKIILDALGNRKKEFDRVLIYTHPANIPGEAIGAGAANRTWGATHAIKQLEEKGENIRNYIFTTLDADHVMHKQYLARLTHLYLTSDKRDHKFYATAMHLFNNNHWDVPAMMRIEANFVTLGTLASRSFPWGISGTTKDTFAAYSTSLQTLIDANYWDVSLGVDDTIFFWRAFFSRDGNFQLATHYIPYSADAVKGSTYWESYKSLYKQLLRWGWGVMEVPFSVKEFMVNQKVSFTQKLIWLYDHFKTRVLLINVVFLITFGFGLATKINPNIKQSSFAYSLPDIMSIILTATLIFLIPNSVYRSKIATPIPKSWPFWKKTLAFMEGFLVIANLLTYSFLPFVDAQTRMMLGKKMKDLYHTPKIR